MANREQRRKAGPEPKQKLVTKKVVTMAEHDEIVQEICSQFNIREEQVIERLDGIMEKYGIRLVIEE